MGLVPYGDMYCSYWGLVSGQGLQEKTNEEVFLSIYSTHTHIQIHRHTHAHTEDNEQVFGPLKAPGAWSYNLLHTTVLAGNSHPLSRSPSFPFIHLSALSLLRFSFLLLMLLPPPHLPILSKLPFSLALSLSPLYLSLTLLIAADPVFFV